MAEMERKLEDLKTRLTEINDLEMASALLNWDQSTYMPVGGAAARDGSLPHWPKSHRKSSLTRPSATCWMTWSLMARACPMILTMPA